MIKRIFIIAFMVSVSVTAAAQKFVWEADFDFRFDNREYGRDTTVLSQTIFGTRISPQAGLGWGNGNALIAGADMLLDFGLKSFHHDPSLIIYYRYENRNFSVHAGAFPRSKAIGDYTYAIFSDSMRFYDSLIEGLMLQYAGERGYAELACDWFGKYSPDSREKFNLFSAGQLDFPWFYAGYNLSLLHYSQGADDDLRGVVDNVLLYPFAGVDYSDWCGFDLLYLQAGWLQAFQNDRAHIGEYVSPGGVQLDAGVERWSVGFRGTLYIGDNLMPYYNSTVAGQPSYGSDLYFGEPFYRSDKYGRLEFYWQPVMRDDIRIRIGSAHHYFNGIWGWQQVVSIRVTLSDKMFDRTKTDRRN